MSKEFGLGLFVVGTLAILIGGIFLIGRRQSLFSSTYPLMAEFDNVRGLNGGAAVRVGGTFQGTVRRIELPGNTDGNVKVVMDLEECTRNLIRKDSVAAIKSEGLLGDKFVEVSIGSAEQQAVREGDTIEGEQPIDISDLLDKANVILDTTTGVVLNAERITTNLKGVTGKIDRGTGTLGALINDRTLYRQAADGTTSFRENMQALKRNFLLRGFFRDRGYEDASKLTDHAIPALPKISESKRFAYAPERLFEKPDNAKLKNEKDLRAAGRFLEQNRFGLVVVAVSNAKQGDSGDAVLLTQARAMVVRDHLVNHFNFDDARVKTLGLGESGGSDSAKVEVIVYPQTQGGIATTRVDRGPAARR